MTTDLRELRALDVFVDNDVVSIEPIKGLELGGAAWLATSVSSEEAHLLSLQHASSLVMERLAGYSLFLLGCHSTWQPDSRIVRHRRLWGALKARHLALPDGHGVAESSSETLEGIRFFGAISLDGGVRAIAAVLEAEPASHLVALRRADEPVAASLVHRGWGMCIDRPDPDVLNSVCGTDGVVFWLFGKFDDREAGCVALAKPSVIDQLLRVDTEETV